MDRRPIVTAGKTDLKELVALLKHVNLLVTSPTAHREAETAKAHRG